MSEYKCQEPGCNFYIGTGGILATELDSKQYYYYSQEVQNHFQMHDEQKREKATRMVAVQFRSQLQERDKVCRLCGGEFSTARKSMAAPTILHLDPAKDGLEYLARVHRVCEIDRPLRAGHPAVKRMLIENYEISLGGTVPMGPKKARIHPRNGNGWIKTSDRPLASGLNRHVVRIKLDAAVPSNVVLQHFDRSVEISVSGVGVGEYHVSVGRDDQGSLGITSDFLTNGRKEHGLAFDSESMAHDAFNSRHGQVVQDLDIFGAKVANDHFSGHEFSLSVGAPNGAGVGASESTERGQTPASSEKEKPSAVAPAEGGETNNPER